MVDLFSVLTLCIMALAAVVYPLMHAEDFAESDGWKRTAILLIWPIAVIVSPLVVLLSILTMVLLMMESW